MADLFSIFSNNILPIFLVAGAGYVAARFLDLQTESLSKIVFYIFSPCLVFDLLVNTKLDDSAISSMFGFAILVMLFLGLLTWFIGSTFIKNQKLLAALTLTTMLMNSGAYGLSLNRLAFGDEALAYASLYFVGMVMLSYTIGVIVASLGTVGWKESVLELIKIPTIYAMALGFIFITYGWQLPEPLLISISSLSDAAIPGLLVLLGVQLQKLQGSSLQLGPLLFANLMRLGGGLVFGFMVSAVLGLESVAHQAGVVESAMPTAVTSIVLATEYDVEPDFVTMVVFTSTLLSPLTLTPLLFYLSL